MRKKMTISFCMGGLRLGQGKKRHCISIKKTYFEQRLYRLQCPGYESRLQSNRICPLGNRVVTKMAEGTDTKASWTKCHLHLRLTGSLQGLLLSFLTPATLGVQFHLVQPLESTPFARLHLHFYICENTLCVPEDIQTDSTELFSYFMWSLKEVQQGKN